jgi:hypothetical protein
MCLILGCAAECRVCNGGAVSGNPAKRADIASHLAANLDGIGEGNLLLGVTGVLPCPVKSSMSDFFVESLQL